MSVVRLQMADTASRNTLSRRHEFRQKSCLHIAIMVDEQYTANTQHITNTKYCGCNIFLKDTSDKRKLDYIRFGRHGRWSRVDQNIYFGVYCRVRDNNYMT